MCFSVFLAQVIGFYTVLTSLAFLIQRDRFRKIASEWSSNYALVAFSGGMSLFLGLLIVISHNMWRADWRVLITLIGWFAVLQGVIRLFFPDHFAKWIKQLLNSNGYLIALGVWLVIGLYLLAMVVM